MRRATALGLLLSVAACGGPPDAGAPPTQATSGPNAPREVTGPRLHEGVGTVLEDGEHGPELCLWVATSLPPQCDGVPLVGWEWTRVEGEERSGPVVWGDFRVVGRLDGERLVVVDAAPPPPPEEGDRGRAREEVTCTKRVDPPDDAPNQSERDFGAAVVLARGTPGFAGVWQSTGRSGEILGETILNVAFTDALRRHEAELREVWGGPLCLVRYRRTVGELRRIQNELSGPDPPFGLEVLSSGVSESRNRVSLEVVALPPGVRDALAERYGRGAVAVAPFLRPVG